MRLDKFLVDCGVGSRTEVKQVLKQKKIQVNGKVETSAKVHIDPDTDQVTYLGEKLLHEEFVYYLLKEVFPVGRLDIDTHGLLLLTNNGKLAHAMLSPKKHVDKVYRAQVAGIMTQEDVDRFKEGIVLKDFTTLPAELEILEVDQEANSCLVQIRIAEGKFHQVKRMVAACGKEVTDLERISMGPLNLNPSLELGEWRRLTVEEIGLLTDFRVNL